MVGVVGVVAFVFCEFAWFGGAMGLYSNHGSRVCILAQLVIPRSYIHLGIYSNVGSTISTVAT